MNNATNADQLRELKHTYNLTSKDVAKILGKSYFTVRSWLYKPGCGSFRNMPGDKLNHLKLILRRRKKVNK